ncbi:hypothetical protein [Endozoicomonas atrinae]|uniref:hypothetical protein n=1 Tax=Endozoicomonas atrinae TaxID=1333660 RepID=UPI003AFF9259
MEKAWAIIIDDDQAACMMAIPRLFEQLPIRVDLRQLKKSVSEFSVWVTSLALIGIAFLATSIPFTLSY